MSDDFASDLSTQFGRMVRRWVLVFSDAESTHRWRSALVAGALRYVRTGIWVKPNAMPQMTGDRPGQGFEPCTIAHAKGATKWNGGGGLALWTHNVCVNGSHYRPERLRETEPGRLFDTLPRAKARSLFVADAEIPMSEAPQAHASAQKGVI
jgi:hypothetical protein